MKNNSFLNIRIDNKSIDASEFNIFKKNSNTTSLSFFLEIINENISKLLNFHSLQLNFETNLTEEYQ